jgi:hypothetical protein
VGGLPGLGAFWLMCGSAFQATVHDEAYGAFMTLPAYARTTEGEASQLGSGPMPCRLGLDVRKCSRDDTTDASHAAAHAKQGAQWHCSC